MALADNDLRAAIAVTRFGLGARPGELDNARRDPAGFLKSQIRREGADQPDDGAPATAERLATFRDYQEARRDERLAGAQAAAQPAAMTSPESAAKPKVPAALKDVAKLLRDDVAQDFQARTRLASTTDAAFRERWATFWANHFTVSTSKQITALIVGPFEREAIRPNVFGRFGELLMAAENHPAMLTYLDEVQSIGPNSPAAQALARGANARLQPVANRTLGLNENLAREILELHTVGIGGGYGQADVTEFARAMTGLSVGGARDPGAADATLFRARAHEPGARTVMGINYAQDGRAQSAAILADLAAKPQTARFVCTKIARHFVADDPSPALVKRLETAWNSSGGDLARVAEALIDAPEAWDPTLAKFKTPYEYVVSSYRAAGAAPTGFDKLAPILTSLGQKPFSAPSPKGWPDTAQDWAAPDAIVKRMQYAQSFSVAASRDRDPSALARDALGARLSPETAQAIARAETRPEGLALLLMSPEFQRR